MAILMCILRDDFTEVVHGATQDWCSRCLRAVIVAPSSRKMIRERSGKVEIVCHECVQKIDPKGLRPVTMTREQMQEVIDRFKGSAP